MAKNMFDNVMKVMSARITFTGATLVSTELDFELPRGYIAKIHDVHMHIEKIFEDFEGLSVDAIADWIMCLVKDPDDITSIVFPTNTVDHDILMVMKGGIMIIAGTAGDPGIAIYGTSKERNYSAEGLDVFTARNMRFNIDAFGASNGSMTESRANVDIHYTLERITDDNIINLLDIL